MEPSIIVRIHHDEKCRAQAARGTSACRRRDSNSHLQRPKRCASAIGLRRLLLAPCLCLGVAIGAEHTKIRQRVVRAISVNVIELQLDRETAPLDQSTHFASGLLQTRSNQPSTQPSAGAVVGVRNKNLVERHRSAPVFAPGSRIHACESRCENSRPNRRTCILTC